MSFLIVEVQDGKKPISREKKLLLEGVEAISFGVRKRERLHNKWFRWKYREEIEVILWLLTQLLHFKMLECSIKV